jgi:hypothetical protein
MGILRELPMEFLTRLLGCQNSEFLPYSCDPYHSAYSGSWRAGMSLLASLISAFFTINGVQDIASYGIARSLGVIDDVKASTSDFDKTLEPPSIVVQETTPAKSEEESSPETAQRPYGSRSIPPSFFASEASNLKLSGVGVFSPAPSQPPSPTLGRRQLPLTDSKSQSDVDEPMDDGLLLRKRLINQASDKSE